MTASPDLGAWLRRQREDRRWSRTEMARRLIRAAAVAGDTAMPSAVSVATAIARWEHGTNGPSERYRLYCCDVLDIAPSRFGIPADPSPRTIVITITIPHGADAQVRITKRGDSAPAGTAGRATAG